MKTLISLIATSVILLSAEAQSAPSQRTAKTTVTGIVVDHDRGLLILKDYKGWDRKQTEMAPIILRKDRKTVKWLDSFDKTHAAIFIKKDDAKGIRNGARVTIEGYSYFYDEWDFYADYAKVTVAK